MRAGSVVIACAIVLGALAPAPAEAAGNTLEFFYVPGILSTPEGADADMAALTAAIRASPRFDADLLLSHTFRYRYPELSWDRADTLGCARARGFGDVNPFERLFPSLFLCAELFADQLHDFFAAHPGRSIVVVGHSQGGLIALLGVNLLGAADRSRVRRVITLDSPLVGVSPNLGCDVIPVPLRSPVLCALFRSYVATNWTAKSAPVRNAQIIARLSTAPPTFAIYNASDPVVNEAAAALAGVPAFRYAHATGADAITEHGLVLRDASAGRAIADGMYFSSEFHYRISGYVTDAVTAMPIAGMAIGAHPAGLPPGVTDTGGFSGSDGFWSTMARPGDYSVGFFPQDPTLRYRGEWWNDQVDYRSADVLHMPGSNEVDRSQVSAALAPLPATFQILGPGTANAINDAGIVVGHHPNNGERAVLWENGTLRELAPTLIGQATALNSNGDVVGYGSLPGSFGRGFVWRDLGFGATSDLGNLPGGRSVTPTATNDSLQVVGVADGGTFLYPNGVLWEADSLRELGASATPRAINSIGVVVGDHFLFRGGSIIELDGDGLAINDSGAVAGAARIEGKARAVVWLGEERIVLPTLGGMDESMAFGINAAGVVVGTSFVSGGLPRLFVWSQSTGIIDAHTFLPAELTGNHVLPVGINNSNQIALTMRIDSVQTAAILTIPSSVLSAP